LLRFYKKVYPGGPGWRHVLEVARTEGEEVEELLSKKWDMPTAILAVFWGLVFIYGGLFGIGFWLYSNTQIQVRL